MPVIHVHSEEEYKKLIHEDNAGKLVIVDYSATWCGPCKKIAPVYESLSNKHSDAVFLHVDVDDLEDVEDVKAIRGVPTFRYFKDGKVVSEFSGANAEKLEQLIASNK